MCLLLTFMVCTVHYCALAGYAAYCLLTVALVSDRFRTRGPVCGDM